MINENSQGIEYYSDNLSREDFLREFFAPNRRLTSVVDISADQAGWLYETSAGNRNLINSNLEHISQGMTADYTFRVGNDALMFDQNNRQRNGHHRMYVQNVSQTRQRHLVRRKVTDEELINIDQNAKRNSDAQTLFVPGFTEQYGKTEHNEGRIVSNVLSMGGQIRVHLNPNMKAKAILHFKDAFDFFLPLLGDAKRIKGVTHAAAFAVFIRAFKSGVDRDKLKYAFEYLVDGGFKVQQGQIDRLPGLQTLFKLNEFLKGKKDTSGGGASIDIYNTTSRMLQEFLEGRDRERKVTFRRDQVKDLFPITLPEGIVIDPYLDSLVAIMGRNVYAALINWCKHSAIHGAQYRLSDIAGVLCSDVRLKGINNSSNSKSIRTVAGRIGRVREKLGKLDFSALGCSLEPVVSKPDAKKVMFYRFVNHAIGAGTTSGAKSVATVAV